jgi:D-alanyl-D-alanine dipeptidase
MKKITLLSLTLTLFAACNNAPKVELKETIQKNISIPTETSQLLVVTTKDWSTKDGNLQRFEKKEGHWRVVGEKINIVIGRNGLGWGIGLHKTPKDAKYIKKEGDGKAPAGLFSLNNAFGYSSLNFSMDFPYSTYKTTDHCVDDSNSIWYNKIIDSTATTKDYKSFEHMKLKNNLYKYGLVVNHNPQQEPQAGSCIFMHIQSKSGRGTAGCTAMKEKEITKVLKWLKEKQKPLLLQLPEIEMLKVDFL